MPTIKDLTAATKTSIKADKGGHGGIVITMLLYLNQHGAFSAGGNDDWWLSVAYLQWVQAWEQGWANPTDANPYGESKEERGKRTYFAKGQKDKAKGYPQATSWVLYGDRFADLQKRIEKYAEQYVRLQRAQEGEPNEDPENNGYDPSGNCQDTPEATILPF